MRQPVPFRKDSRLQFILRPISSTNDNSKQKEKNKTGLKNSKNKKRFTKKLVQRPFFQTNTKTSDQKPNNKKTDE